MRRDGNPHVRYGIHRATHAAITAYLVSQHHERTDGRGYPQGRREVHDIAAPVRRDTAQRAHAVHSVLGKHTPHRQVSPETLMSVAA